MTVYTGEVLAGPAGVCVGLITRADPGLDPGTAQAVVTAIGGGRAKQRKLAQALLDRPQVLTDGRSPAPRVVGNLLIALRNVGATRIAPPRCTQCGKDLRTLQRWGQDWYCGVCGPTRSDCATCGKPNRIAARDRSGQPVCRDCRPDHSTDTDVLIELIQAIDPGLSNATITAAIQAAIPQAGRRYPLVWALQDQPQLLTGAGALAPIPAALRLIDLLYHAGATRIIRPACPHCQRVITLTKPRDGVRLCRNCVAKSRAEPCTRCGAIRETCTRDEHGQPLCANCMIRDPANLEICIQCQRRRSVCVRSADGPMCPTCSPRQIVTCSICGRTALGEISKVTGMPWCGACQQHWARCDGCGQVKPIRSGTRDRPLCSTCTQPDPGFWRACPTCGAAEQLRGHQCARCATNKRLRDLLGDDSGSIRPELQALHQMLTTADRPSTVDTWLRRRTTGELLQALACDTRPLTHQILDELPDSKPARHLRAMLVAAGTLPHRDEQMTRLEQLVNQMITDRSDPDERQLLHRYGVWHLLRRLRQRLRGADCTHDQHTAARQHLRAATVLLNWLTSQNMNLRTCTQRHLDAWLTSDNASLQREAGHFIRWAKKNKLTTLDMPAIRWGGPTGVIDTEQRWTQARRLLHDDTLDPDDRFAGLLVILYAQWPATLSRLTLGHLDTSNGQVRLALGREPIVLPEPLAGLARTLIAHRHGHATLADQGNSPWLFPGGQPGRPISSYQLGERLRQIGIPPAQARSTALFQLATELPAALLAKLLGIHVSVAVAWQRVSAGDWLRYAAEVSRRRNSTTDAS